MNNKEIQEAARAAEKLVEGIKDKDYRVAAFKIVFDHALQSDTGSSTRQTRSRHSTAVKGQNRAPKGGPLDKLREVVSEGFYQKGKSLNETLDELKNRGRSYDAGIIGKGLQRLCQEKLLRRSRGKDGRGRNVYLYNEW